MTTQPRRPGRRPGDPEQTKHAILDAARHTFAANGFDRATIRDIAARADVDPALVMHHFGHKRALFIAAHELPDDPATIFAHIAALPVDQRGEATARAYLSMIGARNSSVFSLLRAAATDPPAAAMYRGFIDGVIIPNGLTILRHPDRDGPLRISLIATQLLGIAVARHIVELEAVTALDIDRIVDAVAPTIQSYIEGPTCEP